jgi:hypothetical protein
MLKNEGVLFIEDESDHNDPISLKRKKEYSASRRTYLEKQSNLIVNYIIELLILNYRLFLQVKYNLTACINYLKERSILDNVEIIFSTKECQGD